MPSSRVVVAFLVHHGISLYYFVDWLQNPAADKISKVFYVPASDDIDGIRRTLNERKEVMQLSTHFGPIAILDLLEFLFDDGG